MTATILQGVGILTISLGAGLIYPPAGIVLLGIGVLVFGIAIERSK
jgi:hypothetical protein